MQGTVYQRISRIPWRYESVGSVKAFRHFLLQSAPLFKIGPRFVRLRFVISKRTAAKLKRIQRWEKRSEKTSLVLGPRLS